MKNVNDDYYDMLNKTQKARWMALISAVDLIEVSCKKYKKNFETIDIKPSALKRYIDTMAVKIEEDIVNDCQNQAQREMNKKILMNGLAKSFSCNEQKS